MSEKYDAYIEEHKENVFKGFKWIVENMPSVLNEEDIELCETLIDSHDESKYQVDEYHAYDAYFYGGNKSFKVVQDFNKAWLKHIHRNPHHWQHWVLLNDNPDEGEVILDMPDVYIIEMICDWWSFSWKQGKLDEIFKWYEEHKDYMKLNKYTRDKVEHILVKIKAKLESDADGANNIG